LGEYLKNGFLLTPLVLGLRDFVRSQECEQFVADTHERVMDQRPHYYLWGLAVDPSQKRSGIGTALMKSFIGKADAEEEPTYLETHDERNVEYYQRMGFSLVHTDKIQKYDLTIWCMVREPLKLKPAYTYSARGASQGTTREP
jgi:ribosomal protein S18 acetylase RimI-like enzyme